MLIVRHTESDGNGGERELYAIQIPRAIEAEGGEAIDAYVAAQLEQMTAPATDTTSNATSEVPTDA